MSNSCNHTALQSLLELEASSSGDGFQLASSKGPLNETIMSEILSAANCSYEWVNGSSSNDTIIFEPPAYYSHMYRIVGTIFQGIVLLVGVLGNSMVVYVVTRTKSMHSPTNCYLVSLALADCIVLIAAVPQEILSYYLVGNQWIWGEFGCAAFIFSQHLGINASSLSLTAFTIERYIAICHPMKAQSVCTVSRAKRIIGGVWVFAVLYCSPWLRLTTTSPIHYAGYPDVVMCDFKLSRQMYLGLYFADLFVFYVVPLLISMVLYSLIARILFHSHRAKASGKYNGPGPLTIDSTKTNAARAQVVKMLVMVVVIFAVLWLPYRGMLVYNSFASMFNGQPLMDLWFLMLAKTCVYINCAINPILYNAMSVKFRRAFGRALTCGKNRENYDRWPYCRTNTTYTTASTALLPSTSTMTYNMTNFHTKGNHINHCNSGSASNLKTTPKTPRPFPSAPPNLQLPKASPPPKNINKTTFTSVDIIVDSDAIHSIHEEDVTQL